MIYYIANLILTEQYSLACTLIQKYYLRMRNCTEVFKGNIWRLLALGQTKLAEVQCTQKMFTNLRKQSDTPATDKIEKIEKSLERAMLYFKRVDCHQGLGLVYLQRAMFHNCLNNQLTEKSRSLDKEETEAIS